MILKSISVAVLLGALVSCQAADSGKKNEATQQSPRAARSTTLTDIGASSLMVMRGSSMVSLASIAANSGRELSVFQFAGVTCESCKEEGPVVTASLAKFASRVNRMVIFPNQVSEFTQDRYEGFTRAYMAGAPYVIDDTLSVIKTVRANSTQYFGVYILVSRDGRGRILNEDKAFRNVEAAVAQVLNP